MKLRNYTTFTNTFDFFKYIDKLLDPKTGGSVGANRNHAGKLLERFTTDWHLLRGEHDYIEVWDANDRRNIPDWVIDKINGADIWKYGAHSYAIDKICLTRSHEIDIHSDKSILHVDKNLAISKIQSLLAVRNNPLVNVRHYILNTNASQASKYLNVHSTYKPLIYGANEFMPNILNEKEIKDDKIFWKNIKLKAKKKPLIVTTGFIAREQSQLDYIEKAYDFIIANIAKHGYAKAYNLAVGAFGKTLCDAVIACKLRPHFHSMYTNTAVPISVNLYHSSQTINSNGAVYVKMLRDHGNDDVIIVVSGTHVCLIDREGNEEEISDRFFKCGDAEQVSDIILECIAKGQSVSLLTLYHHGEIISEIQRLIRKKIPNMKFWMKSKDETDWPCSSKDTAFAWGLDDRTESVITYGSSGTERLSKSPLGYGLNNQLIHGVCTYNYSWSEAENDDLVNKLILITSGFVMSKFTTWFPEFANPDGTLDLYKKVKGIPVDNDQFPNVELLVRIACIAIALRDYPEVERIMGFASRIKLNQLFKENWKFVCNRVLGNTKHEKAIKNIHIEVMNDQQYNPKAMKNHLAAIKRAKSKGRYILLSCFLFNRGYDDKPPAGYKDYQNLWLRHHAGFHISDRDDVTLAQEIWRFTRKDENCVNPFSYYILPVIYNDIDVSKPTWSENTLRTLNAIFKQNKNIAIEFELLQGGGGGGGRGPNPPIFKLPKDFDLSLLNNFIDTVMLNSKGVLHADLKTEAHDWLLQEYLKLAEPENGNYKGKVNTQFLEQEQFKPIYKEIKFPRSWLGGFFTAKKTTTYPTEVKQHFNDNLVTYRDHCKKQRTFSINKQNTIRQTVKDCVNTQFLEHSNYGTYNAKITEIFGGDTKSSSGLAHKCAKDIIDDKKIIVTNVKTVFNIILQTMSEASNLTELCKLTILNLSKHGLDDSKVGEHTLEKFVQCFTAYKRKDSNRLYGFKNVDKSIFTDAEINTFQDRYTDLKSRSLRNSRVTTRGKSPAHKWVGTITATHLKTKKVIKGSVVHDPIFEKHGLLRDSIRDCLKGKKESYKGYTFILEKEKQDA